MIIVLVLATFCTLILITSVYSSEVHGQPGRSLTDSNLTYEVIASGLDYPTGIEFLGPDDILILEQYNGTVLRIKDGKIQPKPLLDVNVATLQERGLLGIDVMRNESRPPIVFLYYTEAQAADGGTILGDRLYKYVFLDDVNGGKLVNRTLLLDVPVSHPPELPRSEPLFHHGGKVRIGPDGNIYVIVGDLEQRGKTQNMIRGADARGSGGILRVTPDGETVGNGILGSTHPLNKYFAYGIRNSFGIDFDPITGYLWDTENADGIYDEINLVEPGFNSGWRPVVGFIENDYARWNPDDQNQYFAKAGTHMITSIKGIMSGNSTSDIEKQLEQAASQLYEVTIHSGLLYDFDGNGVYSDPEFAWNRTVGPTAIQFYNSTTLGEKYLDRVFVGEYNTGKILSIPLNENRTGFDLSGNLSDFTANSANETNSVLFGKGFGGITDIKIGPDGLMYVVELNTGTITKIFPKVIN